jgi:ubiquinone/menaquinone biosynthesis C-methylase UbiE
MIGRERPVAELSRLPKSARQLRGDLLRLVTGLTPGSADYVLTNRAAVRQRTRLADLDALDKDNKMSIEQDKSYFNDSEAYERFMRRWSRAAGAEFLDWIAAPKAARWLDVGCGTGVFTELVLDRCAPSGVIAVDPKPGQIEYVRGQPVGQRAVFQIADSQNLPFPDNAFDVVASALVINFIPDRVLAMAEMRRVSRSHAIVAGYVWDFAGERSPNACVRTGLRQMGIESVVVPGTAASTLEALDAVFNAAGFEHIATRAIDVTIRFPSFEDLWRAQTPVYSPTTQAVAALSDPDRKRLIDYVRAALPSRSDGTVACTARANAIKAHAPD